MKQRARAAPRIGDRLRCDLAVHVDDDRVLLEIGAATLGIAFLVKAAMWPLGFWLPGTYAAAAAPSAALFSILSKVGVYAVVRVWLVVFGGGPGGDVLAWGGMATIAFGVLGVLSSQEQAAAIKAFAASHPFVDLDRVGIWGWSGGGSNTLNCIFRFPDVYKVAAAVAPVPDERLYDSIYEERYMGLPQQNADGYRRGSPITFADGLKGDLLLVHGSGDDNVHYQGTERLVNRLVELGKPFDELVYPNRTHALAEGPGTTVHLYQSIARYFLRHLPAGPR